MRKTIGLLTPYFSQNRGNATTAKRLEAGLSEAGFTVEIFAYEEDFWHEADRKRLEVCDLLHILHYGRFIHWKKNIEEFPNLPYVVTSGGTDLYEPFDDYSLIHAFLQGAKKIIVFSYEGKKKLEATFSLKPNRIAIIPQSVWFPPGQNLIKKPPVVDGFPKLLLPAGLRPVKDVLYLLKPLQSLQQQDYPNLKWVILGPVLDQGVYKDVLQAESEHDWLIYKEPVPLAEIPEWYAWADVVLNSSLSEGQSSALLEAMGLGVPVLARKIPGNASVISDSETGLLFSNEGNFQEKLKLLLTNADLRENMVHKAKKSIEQHHSLKKEMADYIAIYKNVFGN